MEEELARGLVGQDEAIAVISKCIRLSRAGLRYHDRPLGVFLMIGPTVSALRLWFFIFSLSTSIICAPAECRSNPDLFPLFNFSFYL